MYLKLTKVLQRGEELYIVNVNVEPVDEILVDREADKLTLLANRADGSTDSLCEP